MRQQSQADGLANFMYMNDCGKTIPVTSQNGGTEILDESLINNYSKVDSLRVCPSAPEVTTKKRTRGPSRGRVE
jgi:hypothetical protein